MEPLALRDAQQRRGGQDIASLEPARGAALRAVHACGLARRFQRASDPRELESRAPVPDPGRIRRGRSGRLACRRQGAHGRVREPSRAHKLQCARSDSHSRSGCESSSHRSGTESRNDRGGREGQQASAAAAGEQGEDGCRRRREARRPRCWLIPRCRRCCRRALQCRRVARASDRDAVVPPRLRSRLPCRGRVGQSLLEPRSTLVRGGAAQAHVRELVQCRGAGTIEARGRRC